MKEKIAGIARGIIEYELPRIRLSKDRIVASVEIGRRVSGRVIVSNDAEKSMKGIVCSDNRIMEPVTNQFVGISNTVEYVIHAESLESLASYDGVLAVITDCGETEIPYHIDVVAPTLSVGTQVVSSPEQFALFARDNRREALKLYTDAGFRSFLAFHEPKSLFLYDFLKMSASAERAMEEFLVATGRKIPVSVSAAVSKISYEDVRDSAFSDQLTLRMDNPGYVNLQVSSSAEFLLVEHGVVTSEQFAGGTYDIRYVVIPEKMSRGNNYATLTVEAQNQTITIPVFCRKTQEKTAEQVRRTAQAHLSVDLMNNAIAYHMNQIPVGRYVTEAESLLARFRDVAGELPVEARLYRVHLDRLSGRESPANAKLREISEDDLKGASADARAAYVYLRAERSTTDRVSALEQLYSICNDAPKKVIPALLLMQLDDRYGKNGKLRLDELRGIYDNDNPSPLLFLAAARTLNEEPQLLHEIGEFELQTIAFAVRRRFLRKEVAVQFSTLAEGVKEFRPLYYTVLAGIYEQFQLREALTAICAMLIRGHCREPRYAVWFERGVEAEIRVAELYEYYIYTGKSDVEEALDDNVFTYFTYNSKLNDRKLSFLYANIVRHKESRPAIYESFLPKIREYTMDRLKENRNDDFLAILYNDCLASSDYRDRVLQKLEKIAFRVEIECTAPNIHYVVVAHPELEEETVIALASGHAQADIYTDGAVIAFMDANRNRFLSGIPYRMHRLMYCAKDLPEAYERFPADSSMILLHLASAAQSETRFDADSVELRKKACRALDLRERFRGELLRTLVLYYYDNFRDEQLEELLGRLDFSAIPAPQRGRMIGLLILRGQTAQVMSLLERYGFEDVEPRLLERLVAALPKEQLETPTPLLTDMMYELFVRGRRSERVLTYLVNHFQAGTQTLYHVWQEVAALEVRADSLAERLLAQILFTEASFPYGDELIRSYDRPGSERTLIRAYVTYMSYRYLTADIPLGETTVSIIRRSAYREDNDVCVLALLKQYAMKETLTKEEQDFAEYWLIRMEAKGKVLPAFLNFAKVMTLPESLEDKFLIEYRTNPKHHVTLDYSYRGSGKRVRYEFPMRDICYGIFVKDLILFDGETVDYVISDESDREGEETIISERATLVGSDKHTGNRGSRFAQINEIIRAQQERDADRAMDLLNRYIRNEFAISQLFHTAEEQRAAEAEVKS
ncbi:MAG: hypothetical protein IKX54_05105 [Lachnospiraceae bacterium]|nr:hypothetical protein [Lachnospiraceae bacterium]